MAESLPRSSPLLVSVVCTGNICRSPIGEQILRDELRRAGLAAQVAVTSAGTESYHVGQGADPRSLTALERAGLVPDRHVVHQIDAAEAGRLDLFLVATHEHRARLLELGAAESDVHLLRSFDPASGDVAMPDPWYGQDADFDDVVELTRAAMPGVLAEIRSRL